MIQRRVRALAPLAFYTAKEGKPENLAAATARLFLGVHLEIAFNVMASPVRKMEPGSVLGAGRNLRLYRKTDRRRPSRDHVAS